MELKQCAHTSKARITQKQYKKPFHSGSNTDYIVMAQSKWKMTEELHNTPLIMVRWFRKHGAKLLSC